MKRLLIPIAAMMAITAMVTMVAMIMISTDQAAQMATMATTDAKTTAIAENATNIPMAASQVQANAAVPKADDSGANTLICPMNAAATKVEQANLTKATPVTEVLRVICMRAASAQVLKS